MEFDSKSKSKDNLDFQEEEECVVDLEGDLISALHELRKSRKKNK